MIDAITDPQSQSSIPGANPNINAVESASLSGQTDSDNQRILSRQTPSGSQRGTLNITGQTLVTDPITTNPVFTTSGSAQNQTLYNPNNNSQQIVTGKQTDGFYAMKFFDPSGVGIARFGQFSDGETALKVAQSGIEVDTASNDELVFNSNQNIFKIVKTISSVFTYTSGASPSSTRLSIPHNLLYIPLIFGSVNITTNGVSGGDVGIFTLPYIKTGVGSGLTNGFNILGYVQADGVDTTNWYVEVGVESPSVTLAGTITGYVLQETAT